MDCAGKTYQSLNVLPSFQVFHDARDKNIGAVMTASTSSIPAR